VVKVNLIGFKEFSDRLKNADAKLTREVGAEVMFAGEEFARLAKKDARNAGVFDNGQLVGGITAERIDTLTCQVVSAAKHSPYHEWGTITKVKVPAELSSYAIQFKGRGIRKTGGIIPRPFFFKQRQKVKNKFEKNIDRILSDL
jgi:hypothetical protein